MGRVAHSADDATHVGETGDDSGHGVVGVDFVLEIDVAGVADCCERPEDFAHGHEAVTNSYLAGFVVEVREVFHVHIEEARAGGMYGLDNVSPGADGVPDVDAAAQARVEILDSFEGVEG